MQEDNDTIIASQDDLNLRIDKVLAKHYPEQSRTYFQYLIKEGLVLVNGEPIKKREQLKLGDEIEIEFALTPELSLEPENIPLDIIYEDKDLIIVNKPAGLVVHPGAGNWSHTFVNALLFHCNAIQHVGEALRPGIVHRLDKDTSGLLLAAKTEAAHQKLVALFASRKVHKEYLALCIADPKEEEISLPIARHPVDRKKMTIAKEGEGKLATTLVYPLIKLGTLSLVQLVLLTGRTHQIRVHLKAKNAPILGDPLYGNSDWNKKYEAKRQLLHAYRLSFIHPITGKYLSFEAPLPPDMLKFLKTPLKVPSRDPSAR